MCENDGNLVEKMVVVEMVKSCLDKILMTKNKFGSMFRHAVDSCFTPILPS